MKRTSLFMIRLILARSVLLCILSIALANALSAQTHYVFDGTGSWTNTGLWSPSYPGSTIGTADTATITASSVISMVPGNFTLISTVPGNFTHISMFPGNCTLISMFPGNVTLKAVQSKQF